METRTFKTRTDKDGIARIEIPTNLSEQQIEIVVVMQTTSSPQDVDEMGYPIGYFDDTYGMFADEPLERHQPLQPDVRDKLE